MDIKYMNYSCYVKKKIRGEKWLLSAKSAGVTGPAGGEQRCVMSFGDDFKFSKCHVKYCYHTVIQSITGILREK